MSLQQHLRRRFDPAAWAASAEVQSAVAARLEADDLAGALRLAFALPEEGEDTYVYRAVAQVTLAQAQRAVSLGRANGLHRWYLKAAAAADNDDDGGGGKGQTQKSTQVAFTPENDLGNPPTADVLAYTAAFAAGAAPARALTTLASNAKKGSLRAQVGAYLLSKRHLDVDFLGATPSRYGGGGGGGGKKKKAVGKPSVAGNASAEASAGTSADSASAASAAAAAHFNPAVDFWAWSCRSLEWGGPCAAATRSHVSHPSLPVFMHHFGCVAPSYEALEVVRLMVERRRGILARERAEREERELREFAAASQINDSRRVNTAGKKTKAADRPPVAVLDVGSGNGYWTYMLRRHGLAVHAVDSGQSAFRVRWIDDTMAAEGADWLRQHFGGVGRGSKNASGDSQSNANGGGISDACGDILLLVYPVVGADFTRAMLRAYGGRDVLVAGTQNANGFTAFADMTLDKFMEEECPEWRCVAQVPLPSFAGKDEALFAYSLD